MIELALALVAVIVAAFGWSVRRRRHARRPRLAPRLDALPAGVTQLATRVSELSDLGLHLPAASRTLAHERRLGVLLGLR